VTDGPTTIRERGWLGAAGSLLVGLARWRNWRLPVKLGAVMAVPVLMTLALGLVLTVTQATAASGYARANRITELNATVRDLVSTLQAQRQQDATPQNTDALPANPPGASTWRQVDAALATAGHAVAAQIAAGNLDGSATGAWHALDQQITGLAAQRAQSANQPSLTTLGAIGPPSEVDADTESIDGLLAFDRMLAIDVSDAQVAREATALFDIFAAHEEVLYQQAEVLAGIGAGVMSVPDVTALHGSEARLASRISDFRAVATPDITASYGRAVTGPALAAQATLLNQSIDESGGMTGLPAPGMMIQVPVSSWNAANQAVTAGLDQVINELAGQLNATSAALHQQADDRAQMAVATLIAALTIAAAIMFVMARQLLRSIGLLRDTARDIAGHQLPAAVERIRSGETVDPTVTPVPVCGTDEVGQLARAFDAVHGEARRLAVEQANLRANYSDLFRDLSRRSQGLVQRQLRLIEQLERDEQDPDQLSALFQLDHLATRMRRNNENLLVLSGGDLGRGPSRPVALVDVLRGAVSEIEQYQRVQVQPSPDTRIVGYAAGDLVRLLAELLDNATAFSAPDTLVTIASRPGRGQAVVVDIIDHGIGMTDDELTRARATLANPQGVEGRVSRRMGLFVVARLAGEHGMLVRLHGGDDHLGLRATITVPTDLVVGEMMLTEPISALPVALPAALPAAPTATPPAVDRNPPVPQPAEHPAEMTVTIPVVPAVESSGADLFTPLAGEAEEEPPEPETTPIYDTMLSGWFTDAESAGTSNGSSAQTDWQTIESTVDDSPADGVTDTEDTDSWWTPADDGWRAAEAVANAQPIEYLDSGLPRREPKARLLPGSIAEPPAETSNATPKKSPTDTSSEHDAEVVRPREPEPSLVGGRDARIVHARLNGARRTDRDNRAGGAVQAPERTEHESEGEKE
jgi:signal transduction histidine kinase